MGDTSNTLGAATSELSDLRTQVSVLRQQLDAAKSAVGSTNSQIFALQVRPCVNVCRWQAECTSASTRVELLREIS